MMPPKWEITQIEFESVIQCSISYSDAARKLGVEPSTIIRYCKKFGCDILHFDPYGGRQAHNKSELVGLKFGRWTVFEEVEKEVNPRRLSFWRCQCECGTIKILASVALTGGSSTSCGCRRAEAAAENIKISHERRIKYTPQEASARRAFKNYGADGYLSFEDFYELSQLNCFYCDVPPSNMQKSENLSENFIKNGNFFYSGLDRVDSSKPHSIDNILPCCMYCNKSKCAMSMLQFTNHIERMVCNRLSMWNGSYLNVVPPTIMHLPIPKNRPDDYLTPFLGELALGVVIGKWLILAESSSDEHGRKRFHCRCECGTEKIVDAYNIKQGISRSCGDPQCWQEYSPLIYKSRNIWSARYKDADLLFEDFYALSQMACAYCGRYQVNNSPAKDGSIFAYNGLDRIDTSVGHFKNNVVSCCYDCNKTKNDRSLTVLDQWLTAVDTHFIKSGKAAEYLAKIAS